MGDRVSVCGAAPYECSIAFRSGCGASVGGVFAETESSCVVQRRTSAASPLGAGVARELAETLQLPSFRRSFTETVSLLWCSAARASQQEAFPRTSIKRRCQVGNNIISK